jgi:hypothetical protein
MFCWADHRRRSHQPLLGASRQSGALATTTAASSSTQLANWHCCPSIAGTFATLLVTASSQLVAISTGWLHLAGNWTGTGHLEETFHASFLHIFGGLFEGIMILWPILIRKWNLPYSKNLAPEFCAIPVPNPVGKLRGHFSAEFGPQTKWAYEGWTRKGANHERPTSTPNCRPHQRHSHRPHRRLEGQSILLAFLWNIWKQWKNQPFLDFGHAPLWKWGEIWKMEFSANLGNF